MQTNHSTQKQKGEALKALHERDGILIVPNPWDAGSAKMLTAMGFEALATSSGGLAFSLGKPDARAAVTRDETLNNIVGIVAATHLPVTADLENGFGDEPEDCAETIQLAASLGLAGGSIEDATGNPQSPFYSFEHAVERVRAAAETARSLPFQFSLTARAENFLHGNPDLADTIKRLEAFAEAGADVLFAPGLRSKDDIIAVVKAVAPKPVNVLVAGPLTGITVKELEDLGVKRISVGASLARAAYTSFIHAAEEIRHQGTFKYVDAAKTFKEFNDMMSRP
ncbi:isocitrate lyase/phosphoenolpyruvate mutase family protein [Pseudoflavitalea sp. G-6-1-2]|uniref:isocitrate lyase/PEP mutase family protein n=1 Tax=Pseudoflavitalea sp. G-6-1-2 TaxID=2728841 RepID=UPI00146CA454|nr:isocitrate lyase/phosphoenolpyruvate mutase family protein [Pseudoflavitalea sp. G-6-1-2]NML22046.1 isocitrate lyase/phosphoenolpyruvate mutase family protein [Pseudoflavitalea sp. G-6-1-2]